MLWPTTLLGQELSPEQQEVWQFIERCQEGLSSESETAFDCFHEDWAYLDLVARTAEAERKSSRLRFETTETRAYDLRPIGIRVHGNFAVAHYYFQSAVRMGRPSRNASGGPRRTTQRERPLALDTRSWRSDRSDPAVDGCTIPICVPTHGDIQCDSGSLAKEKQQGRRMPIHALLSRILGELVAGLQLFLDHALDVLELRPSTLRFF